MEVVNIYGEKIGESYEECQKRRCGYYRLWTHATRNQRCCTDLVTDVICVMGKCIWKTEDKIEEE